MNFDEFFVCSGLENILNKAKTISKKECRSIYDYILENKPHNILEFGTQYGCSTRMFFEIAKYFKIKINLHSWDVRDQVKYIKRSDFSLHIRDITGEEDKIIESHNPNLIFLDAHPYVLTRNIVRYCLKNKIDFMMHDVTLAIYERLKSKSDNFSDKNVYDAWELYVLCEEFGDEVLSDDFYENSSVKINFTRDRFGLAILKHKK